MNDGAFLVVLAFFIILLTSVMGDREEKLRRHREEEHELNRTRKIDSLYGRDD